MVALSVPPEAAFKLSPQATKAGFSACCAGTQLANFKATGLSCACAAPKLKARAAVVSRERESESECDMDRSRKEKRSS